MARFMNEYDVEQALRRFGAHHGPKNSPTPNRARLAVVVNNLMDWTNENSDGWAYWPKPQRAAARAVALIESRTWAENDLQEREDATDADLKAALRPIKSFLTRHGVDKAEQETIFYTGR